MKALHGLGPRKGEGMPLGNFVAPGKFGRLFPALQSLNVPKQALEELGQAMQDADLPEGDNKTIPAGYTYLGQFIDHDITLDTSSLQEVQVDPTAVENFRTPMLELDSLYGSGPSVQPFLYERAPGASDQEFFLIGTTSGNPGFGDPTVPPGLPNDLPRASSRLGLLGDSRNDENLIVAQLHLAFLKFHNKIVAGLKDGSIPRKSSMQQTVFEEARELVIWHYQWIIVHDFLPKILDVDQLNHVFQSPPRLRVFRFVKHPFIPVEFSVAAYRLGHSMVRSVYNYNRVFREGGVTPATLQLLFQFTAKSGDGKLPVPIPSDWVIDWRRFFPIDPQVPVNFSRKLDAFLVEPLANLPNVPSPVSLAIRNLERGNEYGLPSGQSIAHRLGFIPLTPAQIAQGPDGAVAAKHGLDKESPLWYYILKEGQIQGQGHHLGQVGSRIVAEVFFGLLVGDSSSYLSRQPQWKPSLPSAEAGNFTMVDLLNFVGEINPIGDRPGQPLGT